MPFPKFPTTPARKSTTRRPANVQSHSYSPETGHLTVTFGSGRTYRYEGVPAEIGEAMDTCDSRGSHLHAHVIGKFDHVEITD